jgi:hypothetical protein
MPHPAKEAPLFKENGAAYVMRALRSGEVARFSLWSALGEFESLSDSQLAAKIMF